MYKKQFKFITMKKLQFYFLTLLLGGSFLITSCQDDDTDSKLEQNKIEQNMKQFMTSVEIAPLGRVSIDDNKSARIFSLNIYDKNYSPLPAYSLDGETFVDDGSFYDKVANDGVYTSTQPRNKPAISLEDNVVLRSNEFKSSLSQKGGIKVGCDLSWSREGTSLLGDSCNTKVGCVWLTNCKVEFEFGW